VSQDYSEIIPALPVPEYVPRPQPTIIPTAAWNDTPLFCLKVNDEWVSHILGVLTALDQPDTWVGTEEEIYAARQQVNEIMLMLMTQCEDTVSVQYPRHATLWHDESSIVSGSSFTSLSLAPSPNNILGQFYNLITYQTSVANGDSFAQSFMLDAGDYTFYVLGGQNQYGGLLDWYLDDDPTPFSVGMDWYNAAVQVNVLKAENLTIPTAGRHTLTGVVNGHNGASGAYFVPLVKYWFEGLL